MIFNFYSHLTDGEQGGGGGGGGESGQPARRAAPPNAAERLSGGPRQRLQWRAPRSLPWIASLLASSGNGFHVVPARGPPQAPPSSIVSCPPARPLCPTLLPQRQIGLPRSIREGRGVSRWGLARGPVQESRVQRSERRYSVFSGGWAGRAAGGGPAAAGAARRGPGRPRWEGSLPGAG